MRALLMACLLFCSLALTGCTAVYCVHPLYTSEDEAIVEPPLEGTWIGEGDDKVEFTFQKTADRTYNMVVSGPDSKIIQIYEVHLVRLGDQLFMDLALKSQAVCSTEVEDALGVIAHHVIAKVEITQDNLAYAALDNSLIEEQNKGEYFPLEHVDTEGLFLITSPTEALRKYISDYADRVFSDSEDLRRKADTRQPEIPADSSSTCPKE